MKYDLGCSCTDGDLAFPVLPTMMISEKATEVLLAEADDEDDGDDEDNE